MAKCATCHKFVSAKGGATCSTCTNKYHLACLLPETTHVGSDWKCPDCKKKTPQGDKITTTIKKKQSRKNSPTNTSDNTSASDEGCDSELLQGRLELTQGDRDTPQLVQKSIYEEIKAFMSELRDMREEIRDFRREMNDLRASLTMCNNRVDHLESRLEALENRSELVPPASGIEELELALAGLKLELNDRDQELLSSDLEITNLPEVAGENVIHTVGLVATKLGVTMDERDIVFAQRVGSRAEETTGGSSPGAPARGRRIVVRLARRGLRDELLQSARVRRGVTTADLGLSGSPRRFFLNERLTKSNKHLFYRVRDVGSRLGWKYMWSKRGRILARQVDGGPTHYFRSEDDLERVFGRDIVAGKTN